MTTTAPFPALIDSSMRSAFVTCPRKFFLEYVESWRGKTESIHLTAGGAFAAGIEATLREYHDGSRDENKALEAGTVAFCKAWGTADREPQGTNKTFVRMLGALQDYFIEYPLKEDLIVPLKTSIGSAIEFSFAYPTEIKHPVSNDPIIYAGRFDRLATMGGLNVICDEKTTTQLGASWAGQWRLRAQFTGYIWGAQQAGYDVSHACIRGISILKESYGHVQVLEYRDKWEVERWHVQLNKDLQRMVKCWEDSYWDFNLDSSCSNYGGCPFRAEVCSSPNPEKWLEMAFEKHPYSPIKVHPL